jgi:hypothetical protein
MTGAAAVAKAVADGRLPRADTQTCRACGEPATSWHHPSYEDGMQLVVVAVCTSCHRRLHHALIPDPGTGHLWCKACRSSTGCDRQHDENEAPNRDQPGSTPRPDRINVVLPGKVKAVIERVSKRKGESASNWLRKLALERLLADGHITEADLDDDTDTKESE